jgi:hypothetical protein
MIIVQKTSGKHTPAPKAHRSFFIPFASCAILVNATTVLNPSIAKEMLKGQRSNAPIVASSG